MKRNLIILSAIIASLTMACKKKDNDKSKKSNNAAPAKTTKAGAANMKKNAPSKKVATNAKKGPIKLPSFTIPSLWGGKCTPKDYLGKPSIVEVWSISCPHCRHQAEYLEELAKTLDFNKYAIVSIHIAGGEKMKDAVSKHFKNKKMQVCLDNRTFITSLKTLPRKYQVRGIPHLFLVNSKGEVTEVLRGARKAADLKKKLEALK